ncbi:molecular chaperone DnaJ [Mycetocola tolaasinivorans]|uniref:Molecular chaperone DnaJ n=1 Tax=Mycetocola tolaasinivorans TaxID=76635 RepID=A0A3L7A4V6_9MICO|nr:J domain-containing protein [Mycetocola tolaasinivorans]RLP75247.1 molecular chaperone DnaJ [Mycetocola tolaasinivorans]
MSQSPAERTPYEVLGVAGSASEDELRKAYRRRARETHPDTGGSAAAFDEVQRAWELLGTASARAAYDRGTPASSSASASDPGATWSAAPRPPRQDSRPKARTYGHPGGRARERYLTMLREWVGRGVDIPDPYNASLVRTAPPEIRRELAKALAEEATARQVTDLGMGFTMWSEVLAGNEGVLDHVVLGPAGLFAITSEDWGGRIQLKRGELIGENIGPLELPVRRTTRAARAFAKALRVKFTGVLIVVPDNSMEDGIVAVGRGRHASTLIVQRSLLGHVLRTGIPGMAHGSLSDVFELRSVLQAGIRFP